jgi:TetR/AcrR family transcriptional regulator of autoinduction and epiphytic fitness
VSSDDTQSTDPRVERSRRLICEAALDELAEVGYGAMNMESIAKRASVGKATIYRHWDGKLGLLVSALESISTEVQVSDVGTVRDRTIELLTWLANYLSDGSSASACMPAMVSAAQYDESVREFHHRFSAERRAILVGVLEDGKRAGEISGDADTQMLAEMLVGPLFYRRLMTPHTFPAADVSKIVDVAFASVRTA